jgi:hypothetical protein
MFFVMQTLKALRTHTIKKMLILLRELRNIFLYIHDHALCKILTEFLCVRNRITIKKKQEQLCNARVCIKKKSAIRIYKALTALFHT